MNLLPHFWHGCRHEGPSAVFSAIVPFYPAHVTGSDEPFPFGTQQPVFARVPVTSNCSWTVKISHALPSRSVNQSLSCRAKQQQAMRFNLLQNATFL